MRKYDTLASEEKQLIKLINDDIDRCMGDCWNNDNDIVELKEVLNKVIVATNKMIKICNDKL